MPVENVMIWVLTIVAVLSMFGAVAVVLNVAEKISRRRQRKKCEIVFGGHSYIELSHGRHCCFRCLTLRSKLPIRAKIEILIEK
jgi:hypothetical protein